MDSSDSSSCSSSVTAEPQSQKDFHSLHDTWTMYAHLPHDTDWSIDSYKAILQMNTLEECIALFEAIPKEMTQNCMLFLMRDNIKPLWEDVRNRKGGSFSFKVNTSNVHSTWKDLCYSVIGNTISDNNVLKEKLNGITISPKRNFCIVKLWMSDCSTKTLKNMKHMPHLNTREALFRKHNPEY